MKRRPHWLLAIAGSVLGAQAPAPDVKLIHGAGTDGSSWNAVIGQWAGAGIFVTTPTIGNQGDMTTQAATYLTPLMVANHSVLVGFSKGGLIARASSASVTPRGIVTMSTPNAGLPLANNLPWVLDELSDMTFQVADVLLLTGLQQGWIETPWTLTALTATAYSGASYLQNGISDGLLTQLSQMEPNVDHFAVGSGFVGSLPSGGNNRFSLSVQQSLIAQNTAPFSAIPAWSQNTATNASGYTYALGSMLWQYAADAYDLVNWNSLEGILAYFYLGSAQQLAMTLMDHPYLACRAVSFPGPTGCLANDGLVPMWSQAYPGGVNLEVAGPPHAKAQTDAGINAFAISRVQGILAS